MAELTAEESAMVAAARGNKSETISLDAPTVDPVASTVEEGKREEWGPYYDEKGKPAYRQVQCPTGVYAVPANKALFFVPQEVFSRKEARFVRMQQRLYRTVEQTQEEVIEAYRQRVGGDVRLLI